MVFALSDVRAASRYMIPRRATGITAMASRPELYQTFESYYYNTVYEELGLAAFDAALATVAANATIRGIYNPVAMIVDFYAKFVLTGRIGLADEGADLTIDAENARIIEPLLRIWKWSNLQTEKDLVPFYAANLGDCLLVAVDRPPRPATGRTPAVEGRVWIEVRHPRELADYDFDDRGNLVYAKLEATAYERDRGGRRQSYTYGRVFTKTEYRTEKDHRPFSYRDDGRMAWPNPHGFVPVVLIQHKRIGDEFGLNAYHNALGPINEINMQASNLGTLLGEHLAPQWAIFGASLPTGGLARDGKVWGFPNGTDAKALIAEVRATDAYTHIGRILQHLEAQFPELALPRMREQSQASGVAVRGQLMDLIRNGEMARHNYEAGLVRAGEMALTMGTNAGGAGQNLWGGDIGDFGAGEFEHHYEWPAILPISDTEQAQLDRAVAETVGIKVEKVGIPRSAAWRLLDYTEEEIATMLAESRAEQSFAADLVAGDGSASLRAELGEESTNGAA